MFRKLPFGLAVLGQTAAYKLSIVPSLAQSNSVPACNSADFPKCLKAETAGVWKLQADQDKHPKDYVVPNFGIDRDIIATKTNLKNAEAKLGDWVIPASLAQSNSVPACNSADFPKCLKAETAGVWKLQADQDKHPKDYVVPNFGVDRDIITTKTNLKNAEAKLGDWVIPKTLAQLQSVPACNSADFPKCLKAETAGVWKLQADQDKHPKDYVVPNFGVDRDIITTKTNLKNAEAKLGDWVIPASLAQHTSIPACNSADFPKCLKAETQSPWKLQADMDKHPKDYKVPNFGIDRDIITTKTNLKNAEAKLGDWVIPKALAQSNSVPACNSADFPKCLKAETAGVWKLQADQDKHPKDYVVPNFGIDRDIITTKTNLKNAESKLGDWVIPKTLTQLQSVPACNSADFPKCLKAETAGVWKLQADQDKHPKDYVVPNFGIDRDIITTKTNLKNAEAKLGDWVIPKSLAQARSIPACNTDHGCYTETASPWKENSDAAFQSPADFPAPTPYIPAARLVPGFPNAQVAPSPGAKGDAKGGDKEGKAPAAAFIQMEE